MTEEFNVNITFFANKVAEKMIKVYEELPKKGKPTAEEYTVLSGMLLFDKSTGYMEVVSIGTGTKCLSGVDLSPAGNILNDSHAEVIARRGLLIYLYDTIKRTLQGEMTMFKLVDDKLELGSDYEFHFYSSQMPCGDACITDDGPVGSPVPDQSNPIEMHKRKAEKITYHKDSKKPKLVKTINKTGAKCLPHSKQDTIASGMKSYLLGQVRTKPGRGERTLSVTCSDKLSKWMYLGVQGSLLGMLLRKPIYLSSVVIGAGVPFSQDSLKRAVVSRNPNFNFEYRPSFEQSSVIFPYRKSETRARAGPASIVWVNLNESYSEVGVNGVRLGLTKKYAADAIHSLGISKYYLFKRFVELLLLYKEETLKNVFGIEKSVHTIPYNEMKRYNKEYFDKWAVMKREFFQNWTSKPDIWDFCAGNIDDIE